MEWTNALSCYPCTYTHTVLEQAKWTLLNDFKIEPMQLNRKKANTRTIVWHVYAFSGERHILKNGIWDLFFYISVSSSYMDERKIKWVLQEEIETFMWEFMFCVLCLLLLSYLFINQVSFTHILLSCHLIQKAIDVCQEEHLLSQAAVTNIEKTNKGGTSSGSWSY